MENIIFELEQKMWNAAAGRDKEAFLQLVSLEAVMVCGGFRCSGADYAELIKDFGISSYEITNFETVAKTEQLVQVCYIVKAAADSPETVDRAGSEADRHCGGFRLRQVYHPEPDCKIL